MYFSVCYIQHTAQFRADKEAGGTDSACQDSGSASRCPPSQVPQPTCFWTFGLSKSGLRVRQQVPTSPPCRSKISYLPQNIILGWQSKFTNAQNWHWLQEEERATDSACQDSGLDSFAVSVFEAIFDKYWDGCSNPSHGDADFSTGLRSVKSAQKMRFLMD